ncbi:MAG: sodium/solute symporter [Prolixibacteraceae bacterium]|jgi:solute:Na+ symporter, SSS family|nr:sodium/solute symporter [Prolixibacteraceae bacterium]MBT6762993.1 sodium/solute symporter [Prolixibacteraceae bacterium]MBT6997482.1 sodium/solute symporter [Prolixibacteraceae bacterium]MBT7396180.1 sodium/solute symporter [Prolixibacteraceae bacterium]
MASLDWIVLGLFVLALVGIVIWVIRKKDKNTTDYFLAGRDATWIAIGASIFASNIGSEHLVGLAGAGAESGMAMAHWEMHGWMILMLGWLFVPFYSRSKVFTMPEFLERRYNSQARSFLSIISLVSYILTKVAVTVYAGGVVFKDVFDIDFITFWGYNIDFFWVSAIGLVVLTGLYTTFGGMKAVLYTSVLQTPILLIGSIAVLVLGLIKIGGWNEMMEICRANVTVHGDSMTSLMRSPKDIDFPWTGVILGSAIIGFWYWCTDQFIVQRVLSGRDMKQARRGTIFGAYLKLTPVFIFLIPGMIAYALNQKGLLSLSSNDAAFSTMVKELLPIGFKGVVIGGILAALMSSLASLFNSSAMLFTIDFYQKYKPNKSEKHYVTVGRIATVVIVMLGIAWIPVMKGLGKVLYEYLQDVQSLLAPGIAAVFLLGVVSKRTTPAAGIWGLVIGFTLGMTRLGLNVFSGSVGEDSLLYSIFLSHNWLHYEIYLFFVVIASMVVISYFTKKKDPALIAGLTMGSASAAQRAETRESYNYWDIINSVIIITIILVFYAYFW